MSTAAATSLDLNRVVRNLTAAEYVLAQEFFKSLIEKRPARPVIATTPFAGPLKAIKSILTPTYGIELFNDGSLHVILKHRKQP